MLSPDLWREFAFDPRDPAYATVRAGTADRSLMLQALSEAYAEGQLDREELDERTDAVNAAKTLGELPPLLADLVPVVTSSGLPVAVGSLPAAEVQRQAVEKWSRGRGEALMGWLVPTVICWVVWTATMFGGFPWPLFPMIGTGIPLARQVLLKQDIIAGHRRSIVKKHEKAQLKAIKNQQPPELPPA
jgi:hypothetical protein